MYNSSFLGALPKEKCIEAGPLQALAHVPFFIIQPASSSVPSFFRPPKCRPPRPTEGWIMAYRHVNRHSLPIGFLTPQEIFARIAWTLSITTAIPDTRQILYTELTPHTTLHNGQDLVSAFSVSIALPLDSYMRPKQKTCKRRSWKDQAARATFFSTEAGYDDKWAAPGEKFSFWFRDGHNQDEIRQPLLLIAAIEFTNALPCRRSGFASLLVFLVSRTPSYRSILAGRAMWQNATPFASKK